MRGLVDNALVAEMDVREVDMSVLDAGDRNRGSRLCRAAAHLRSAETKKYPAPAPRHRSRRFC